MGLDQYVFRVTKPKLEDRVYTAEELGNMGLNKAFYHEAEKDMSLIKELLPYTEIRDVRSHFLNTEKIIQDYNLPSDAYISYMGPNGMKMRGHNEEEQFISQEEIDKKYVLTKELPCYIWHTEEVQYWRKNYELQDWIANVLKKTIENTGYYRLNKTIIHRLNGRFDADVPEESKTKESALFYHEWY